jgi:predicted DNA-binding transcriptional regulator AlpA
MPDRYLNISQMSVMFNISRPTIRKRLKDGKINPSKKSGALNVYDMAKAGPAIFCLNK